jgi:hypothetical protein
VGKPVALALEDGLAADAEIVISSDPDRAEAAARLEGFTLGPSEAVVLRLS